MSSIESILYVILTILIFVVFGLIVAFFMIKKKENEAKQENNEVDISEKAVTPTKSNTKIAKDYETKSIFDFMEFETVKDNMIVQNGGKKFLMAIECKGINYDLMSEVEKTATEQGFASFLNSLGEPIQIYIQTRTINLEKNIQGYKEKVEKIRDSINIKEFKLREYMDRPQTNEKILKDKQFELMREKNLYSYGQDIVADTKKMSLNKNVLKKKYYVIIRYYYDDVDAGGDGKLSEEEIRETAFSNLYTKAVSLISVLSGIGIVGRTLNSFELVELLYNAYNRDDSEVFGIDKALEAGYDEIYVDSQSVIEKRIEALNKEILLKAQDEAKNAIDAVIDERKKELDSIEENIDSIVLDLAQKIIEDEETRIPADIKKEVVKKIEKKNNKKGEDESNGNTNTKETSRRHKAS